MSAIEYSTGNLFEAEAEVEALVNTVNTEGFMGKGIAAEFKRRFPRAYFEHYEAAAKRGELDVGTVLTWEITEPQLGSTLRYIVDFPTKRKWRARARIEWIEQGLDALKWSAAGGEDQHINGRWLPERHEGKRIGHLARGDST